MWNFRILFCLLFLAVWTASLRADQVTVQQAQQMAARFLQQGVTRSAVLPHQLKLVYDGEDVHTRSQGQSPAYYVFNHTGSESFVMVAADDRVTPILAYSYESSFHTQHLPDNLRAWLQQMRAQIHYARQQGLPASPEVKRQRTRANQGQVVSKHVTAHWDQAKPYWNKLPKYQQGHYYTGCVSTALAIVMRFHQHPQRGVGVLPAYTSFYQGDATTPQIVVNMPKQTLGYEYKWDLMPLTVKNNISTQQADAISTLLYDCVMMAKAVFYPDATGAYLHDLPAPLVNHMGYDKGVRFAVRNSYPTSEWYQMLKDDLNHHPVFYAGYNKQMTSAHAFVLDGYTSNNYFSVNWGWSGMSNGYYLLDALIPDDVGIGGGDDYDFSFFQNALLGLRPDQGSPECLQLRFLSYYDDKTGTTLHGLHTQETQFQKNKVFQVSYGSVVSYGSNRFEGALAMAVANRYGQMKPNSVVLAQDENGQPYPYLHSFAGEDYPLFSSLVHVNLPVSIPVDIEPGDCLALFYQPKGSREWLLVEGNPEEGCVWKLPLTFEKKALDQGTRLYYDKVQRLLQVITQPDTQIDFCDDQGRVLTNGVELDPAFYKALIRLQDVPAGRYVLRLTRGEEVHTVPLIF